MLLFVLLSLSTRKKKMEKNKKDCENEKKNEEDKMK